MSNLSTELQKQVNPKVFAVFSKLAGKKLDKATELTFKLFNEQDKQLERAMGDALEQLNLLPKVEVEND